MKERVFARDRGAKHAHASLRGARLVEHRYRDPELLELKLEDEADDDYDDYEYTL